MNISIATLTLVRKGETELVKSALLELKRRGLPLFVTDGGSDDNFLRFLNTLATATVKRGKPGVFHQTKLSLSAAVRRDTPYILYTEPDKKWFFENKLDKFLKKASKRPAFGIAFPSRDKKSFATFPKSQQQTESFTNQLCKKFLNQSADYFYGPMLIHRDLIPYLDLAKEDLGWGWRPFLMGIAHRLEKGIEPIKMELRCPKEQRENNEAELLHRMNQLQQNVRGLLLSQSISDVRLRISDDS